MKMSSLEFFPVSWRLDENFEKISIIGLCLEGTVYLEIPFRPWITIKYDYSPENLLCVAPISDMISTEDQWQIVCDNKESLDRTIKVLGDLKIQILDSRTSQLTKFLKKKGIHSHSSLRAFGLNPLPLYQLYGKKTSTCSIEFSILDLALEPNYRRLEDLSIVFTPIQEKNKIVSINITEFFNGKEKKSILYDSDEKNLLSSFFEFLRSKDPTLCVGPWDILTPVYKKVFHSSPVNFSRMTIYHPTELTDCPGRICLSIEEIMSKLYPYSYDISSFDPSILSLLYEVGSFWCDDAQRVYTSSFKSLCRNLLFFYYKGDLPKETEWEDYRLKGTFVNVTERSTEDLFRQILKDKKEWKNLIDLFDRYPGGSSKYSILATSSLFSLNDIYNKAQSMYPKGKVLAISPLSVYLLEDTRGMIDILINHRNGTLIEKNGKRHTFGYSPLLNSCIGLLQKALNLYIQEKLASPEKTLTADDLFEKTEQFIEDYLLNIVLHEDDFVNVSGSKDLPYLSSIKNIKRSLAKRVLSIGRIRPQEVEIRYLLVDDTGTLLEEEIEYHADIPLNKNKYKNLYYGAIDDLI